MDNRKTQRLDTLLRTRGAGSKREIQKWIQEGSVFVEGRQILEPFFPCSETATISVCGKDIVYQPPTVYMMNKPAGTTCVYGDSPYPSVFSLLREEDRGGIFSIGRLDADTTGLLLLTNDGNLNEKISRPHAAISKVYQATLDRPMIEDAREKMAHGITLQGGARCQCAILQTFDSLHVSIRVTEGKYHEVKRLVRACGARVRTLHRVSIGGLSLDDTLSPGAYRQLTADEIHLVFKEIPNPDEMRTKEETP